MTKLQQLSAMILSFGATRGQPEATSLAWAVQDLIDERIKLGRTERDAARMWSWPEGSQPGPALKPKAAAQLFLCQAKYHESNSPIPCRHCQPFDGPTAPHMPRYNGEPPTHRPNRQCQHDLFASGCTLVLSSRTVKCTVCNRSRGRTE